MPFLAVKSADPLVRLSQLGMHAVQGAVVNSALGLPLGMVDYLAFNDQAGRAQIDAHGGVVGQWWNSLGSQALSGAARSTTAHKSRRPSR